MSDINEVRKALWLAYKKLEATEEGIEGKSVDGCCELLYPNIWDCKSIEQFSTPSCIMVYSYALGPSRQHYFYQGNKESNPNYYTWISKNMYKKAVEIINQWADNI